MLNAKLLCIGKTKFRWVADGVAHYQKLIKPLATLTIQEIKAVPGEFAAAEQMKKEAERFRGNLERGETLVCLDRDGQRFTSEAFARWIGSKAERDARLTFVVGGELGLDPEFKRKASSSLSLSAMTYPHDLVRLIFAEQLYRALAILHGHPYHK
jgi:23S rRNA (pseudouridine1915-N3)-methyltransferase